ncbi:MAG TPA: hypothetical protein PKY06_15845 [Saprospiraceae bacterium]|nr:hypothetical protein [Saprospiraceae bacterium]
MKYVLFTLAFMVFMLSAGTVLTQSLNNSYYRHSIQFNVAGLAFERWGIAYEIRINPRHALFFQGGGAFPSISEEKEYGLGLHYKYFLKPVSEAKFLGLFKVSYRNTFADLNLRYFNLDGIHKGAEFLYHASFVGLGIGQTYVWNKGFTVSYWLGYGPPFDSEYKWKNEVPEDGDTFARNYKVASGLDFGLTLGYSFGRSKI